MHVLTSAYFSFDVKFYEQSHGVAMGFPLYPVIPDVFMEDFEDMTLSQATHKLLCWFCYMNDTFFIWPHGSEKLLRFVDHLNDLHSKKFTLETEKDEHFVYFTSTSVGHWMAPWGRNVYQKPTHTSLYQNYGSRHHHSNKQAILATLSHREDCKQVVTRKAFILSRNPLRPHLGKTGTVLSRHHVPTTRQ
jgi:hypothetical protein